jgi:hypothetical protein
VLPARAYDTLIVGGGPVGLATALIAARYGSVLLVVGTHSPTTGTLRIDCIPVALLALFVELGVHPAGLGAGAVHDDRLLAWESVDVAVARGAGTVHILRPALEQQLLARVRTHRAISVVTAGQLDALPPAVRVLDATGRRAITAEQRQLPANPGILRAIIARGSFSRAQQAFRLAALPTGYAYRLGTTETMMVGLVQGRDQWRAGAGPLEQRLHAAGAGWIVSGMPLDEVQSGLGGVASVQWSEGRKPAIRIGDSALARDALASQGIANGISAALVLFESRGGKQTYNARLLSERRTHLASLERLIGDCLYRACPFWHDYRFFLRENRAPGEPQLYLKGIVTGTGAGRAGTL